MGRRRRQLEKPRSSAGTSGYDADQFGRATEAFARLLGTGRYVAMQSFILVAWLALTFHDGFHDLRHNRSLLLLNLVFSAQAAYAAPLILVAQNREDDRDKQQIERERDIKARQVAELDFLARELADVRLIAEQKIDRADFAPDGQITRVLDRLRDVVGVE